jgi:hypothetical protein
LIKVDIEGGEWELVRDPRFTRLRAPALVIEYHPLYWQDADARHELSQALDAAGYSMSEVPAPAEASLVWRSPEAS